MNRWTQRSCTLGCAARPSGECFVPARATAVDFKAVATEVWEYACQVQNRPREESRFFPGIFF